MTILYEILSTIFTIIAAVVVVSFSFLWYEAANRDPALLNGRTSPPGFGLQPS